MTKNIPPRRVQALTSSRGGSPLFSRFPFPTLLLGVALLICSVYMMYLHRLASSSLLKCTSLAQSQVVVDGGSVMIPDPFHQSRRRSSMTITGKKNSTLTQVGSKQSFCQAEYDRVSTATRTPGLTDEDLRRSQAWLGNQYRLSQMMNSLSSRQRPVVVVVAGGSISMGHGVTPESVRYADRLEAWMNDMFPLDDGGKGSADLDPQQREQERNQNKHKVINVAAHGADMCAMAKRLNNLYLDLSFQMPPSSQQPDLIILEFGVNDYQGQDHLITVDHKTSVFFDGFRDLTLCAEVVVHALLSRYPTTAIVFLEMQTAIVTRKTGALLHMGVAQHYQVPVISYSEALFPDFFRLIALLEKMEDETGVESDWRRRTYSFKDEEWKPDGDLGDLYRAKINTDPDNEIVTINIGNLSKYSSAILPFPHGCSPCQPQHIIPQFRQGGCKSICTFLERSGMEQRRKQFRCNAKLGHIPPGRSECFVPFFAHDAVHPSAAGHGIAMDLIVHSLALAQLRTCEGQYLPRKDVMPLTTFVAESFHELEIRADFLWVHDVARAFSRWEPLRPKQDDAHGMEATEGFQLYADDDLKQRPGWIATNPKGGEQITFSMQLPPHHCYVVYLAILRSYKGMGTMNVEVKDYGDQRESGVVIKTTVKKVDGLWNAPISVWSDVQITDDYYSGCTGYCEVTVTTNPMVKGRYGNKVKLLTLSARRCSPKLKN